MKFNCDVQIHSKYSMATSKNAVLEEMAYWAIKKGIKVLGTGDFTHPQWLSEIKQKLLPTESGLFYLKKNIQNKIQKNLPEACKQHNMFFMLEVEISTIYKKNDKVKKIHHLIFVPDLASADKLITKLSKIGNLASDGRPILKLSSRNLLEIVLETNDYAYLIPAHIWTPWFAVMGSKSGFDSIEECYEDLSSHIFAIETGLSSDPQMNWRISNLDKYKIVSNSDAHSPPKIGREATVYNTKCDYFSILNALKTGNGLLGTIEFFPEEGKYFMDGHRKCNICLTPKESAKINNICPVCKKNLTIGVLNRINSLADRSEEEVAKQLPINAKNFINLMPLVNILSEIYMVGEKSKKVANEYENLLNKIGPELLILESAPIEEIRIIGGEILSEAISRLRAKKVIKQPGYDGKHGIIKLFKETKEILNLRAKKTIK